MAVQDGLIILLLISIRDYDIHSRANDSTGNFNAGLDCFGNDFNHGSGNTSLQHK